MTAPPGHRVIVGTAGHVDHGKTRLVEALTGIDCDRWQEEKDRGITIDLGFAHRQEGDLQLGFIDVPGHERFVRNALAGLGGIRVVLLVIAADEGVQPQTREHLAICSLLEIPTAVVALTKADLVTPDLLELARLEAEELLASTRFAGAPVLAVSSASGEGVEELAAILAAAARGVGTTAEVDLPLRLPIDRAFHLKGQGVIATGTLVTGAVRPGDVVALLPAPGSARVRSVQVHGEAREQADAGERTAVQLAGIELGDLHRGMELSSPGAFAPATALLARYEHLAAAPAPLTGWAPVRFHLLAAEVAGRLRPLDPPELQPGQSGVVELRLGAPVVAVRGDRFIVRRPSPPATLGGGRVLDPAWKRRRGGAFGEALSSLEGDLAAAVLLWVREAGEGGAEAEELARRAGRPAAEVASLLAGLVAEGRLLEAPAGPGHRRRWLDPEAYRRVRERARRTLRGYFRRDRLASGMPKAEAVARILPGRAGELAEVYLAWLEAENILVGAGNQVAPPGRTAELSGDESSLARAILARFEGSGLAPPSPQDLRHELAAKPQILEGVLRYLVDRGRLVRLPNGLLVAAAALARLRTDLLAGDWERFNVGEFKERFGLTRKWAIPLLEHLDSTGATRRIGDERQVVRATGGS